MTGAESRSISTKSGRIDVEREKKNVSKLKRKARATACGGSYRENKGSPRERERGIKAEKRRSTDNGKKKKSKEK